MFYVSAINSAESVGGQALKSTARDIFWRMLLTFTTALSAGCAHAVTSPQAARPVNIYVVGQDLDAIRGYYDSGCCEAPDGTTAYVTLYNVLDTEDNYGGLGVSPNLTPTVSEAGWGSGPVSAWKSAKEFDGHYLAIGLSITEQYEKDGLNRIAAGEFDREIAHLTAFARATDKTVLLRIGYEFDGHWNAGYDNPVHFVAAWKRIVDQMRAQGATNVRFIWQASTSPIDDILDRSHDDIANWYPGDDYVDWVGASWFVSPDNMPTTPLVTYKPPSARVLMDEILTFARAHGKPVMIAELSPQGFDLKRKSRSFISPLWDGPPGTGRHDVTNQQIWDLWFQPFLDYLAANDDVIDAIAYINVNWDAQPMWSTPYANGYWGDTRLEVNPVLSARWNKAIGDWRDAGTTKNRGKQ